MLLNGVIRGDCVFSLSSQCVMTHIPTTLWRADAEHSHNIQSGIDIHSGNAAIFINAANPGRFADNSNKSYRRLINEVEASPPYTLRVRLGVWAIDKRKSGAGRPNRTGSKRPGWLTHAGNSLGSWI
jgi:hypothetical protein